MLLYCARVGDRARALRVEYRVKQLSRHDKSRLVNCELSLDRVFPARDGD